MFQLAHMSDIHLAPLPQPSWRQLAGKRTTGYLNWKLNRKNMLEKGTLAHLVSDLQRHRPGHIAISGDLVNLSLEQEFINARDWLSTLGKADNISLVPGNHDAYVAGAFARFCHFFAPWMRGDKADQGKVSFPFVRIRHHVAVIGVSSALATPPFCAAGYLDPAQAQRLGAILRQTGEKGLFRVVMIHHPPLFHATHWYKRLWGIKRFQAVVAGYGAELVLHGHTHLPTLSFIKGPGGPVPVVGVASASQDFGGHKPPAGYNLFEIGKNRRKEWQCTLTRHTIVDDRNTVAETERHILHGAKST